MRFVDLIEKKSDGGVLSREEIQFMVNGFVKGDIPDYQMSSMMMAILQRGMSDEEAIADIHQRVDDLASSGRFACRLKDMRPDRKVNLAEELYRYSRKKYLEMNG